MADSSKVENTQLSAPQPQITVTEAPETVEKSEKELSETTAQESVQKVEAAVEKPGSTDDTKTDSKEQTAAAEKPEKVDTKSDAKGSSAAAEEPENAGDTKTDVKEQSAAVRGEAGESQTTLLQDWERLQTAIKQPAADTSEHRTLGNVETGQPRAPRRRVRRDQIEEEIDLCRRYSIGEYWKAIFAFSIVSLGLVVLIYTHRYLYSSTTHEELVYNARVALISGGVAILLGIFALYHCIKSLPIIRWCRECVRDLLTCVRQFDQVAFENRPEDSAGGDVESKITQAEMDADDAAAGRSGASTSRNESTSSERHAIFSSPVSDDASSKKMSEIASAVTSIVSETLSKGAKEKLTESSDSSKEGSTEVSGSSTESSSDTLTESGEVRRRNVPGGEKNGATRSSDEESTKKE